MSKDNSRNSTRIYFNFLEEHDVLLLASSSKLWDTSQGKQLILGI